MMKSGPRLLQLEKALAQKRRPNTAKNLKKKKKKKRSLETGGIAYHKGPHGRAPGLVRRKKEGEENVG